MYFEVRYFEWDWNVDERYHVATAWADSYEEALVLSREYVDFDLAMIFDAHEQYIITRDIEDGELCREDEL